MIKAELLAATRPYKGSKQGLITFQVECPIYVWTELLTHRRFARNASSARAMGTERYTAMGYHTPPIFYKQGKGMQSSNDPIEKQWLAELIWNTSTKLSMFAAKLLERLGVAKEQRNRLVPPNKIIRGIVTGTEDSWRAFLELRNHHTADKAMQTLARDIAYQIQQLEYTKTTVLLSSGQAWLVDGKQVQLYASGMMYATKPTTQIVDNWKYASLHNPLPHCTDIYAVIAQIARVSYNRDKGKDDQALFTQLVESCHYSPLEHVAYWTFNPWKSCYTSKHEDMAQTHELEYNGWQSFRSEIEHTQDKDEVIAEYNALLTTGKSYGTIPVSIEVDSNKGL